MPAIGETNVSIDGNQTVALARGNPADNQLVISGSVDPAGAAADATIGRYDATAHAAGALLNSQTNDGAVNATGANSAYSTPLNSAGAASASMLGTTGNSESAAANGNIPSNAVSLSAPGRVPTAAIANVQTNYGPVAAQVTGAS